MNDRATIPPQNSIKVAAARVCANDDVYDTTRWNGACPTCETQHGFLLRDVLENRNAAERAAVIVAADRVVASIEGGGDFGHWLAPPEAALIEAVRNLRAKVEAQQKDWDYPLSRAD